MDAMTTWTIVLIVVAVAGAVLALTGARLQDRRSTEAQLTSIRRKLDLVMEHLGIAEAAPERAEVVRHLEDGRPIEAVRAYRRATGASLLEAKRAVDRLAPEHELRAS
jgi:ribosomal protein L7/L12